MQSANRLAFAESISRSRRGRYQSLISLSLFQHYGRAFTTAEFLVKFWLNRLINLRSCSTRYLSNSSSDISYATQQFSHRELLNFLRGQKISTSRVSFHSEKREPLGSDTRLVIQQPRLPTNLNRLCETAIIMARADNRSASEKVFGATFRYIPGRRSRPKSRRRRPSSHDLAIWVDRGDLRPLREPITLRQM